MNTQTITNTLAWVKEALFPRFCVGCNREGTWFCHWCQDHFDPECLLACPGCNLPTQNGERCQQCESVQVLSGSVSLGVYEPELPLAKLITAYKYAFAEELAGLLQSFTSFDDLHEAIAAWRIDAIVPVPLHPRRYAERGFNQALPIAEAVSIYADVPVSYALKRTKYTTKQARLSKKDRQQNVQGAFDVKEDVEGKRVLLVDDVYTTGATMTECALVLQDAGARQVFGFTLARGR